MKGKITYDVNVMPLVSRSAMCINEKATQSNIKSANHQEDGNYERKMNIEQFCN